MEKVKKRDFLHFPNRYMEKGDFIVTKHGKPEYIVTVTKVMYEKKEVGVGSEG